MPAPALTQGAELIARWRFDLPLWWADNLAIDPHPWQAEVNEALSDPRVHRAAYVAPRGAGKTLEDAAIALHHLTTNADSVVVAIVPVFRQAESLLDELRRLWLTSPTLPKLFPSWRVEADGIATGQPGWRLILASSSRGEWLEGAHSIGPALVLIDEARTLPDSHFDSLQGILTTPGSRLVVSSVAGRPSGFLYRSLHGDRWFWDRVLTFTAAEIPHLHETAERERKRLGADDPLYAQQWESRFVDVAQTVLFSAEMIEPLIGFDAHADERFHAGGARDRILGVDPSGRGSDDTALVLRAGKNIEHLGLLPTVANEMALVEMVSLEARRHRADQVVIDEIGLGGPIAARLEQRLEPRPTIPVLRFNASAAARDREAYASLKTETLIGLRRLMIDEAIGFPSREDSTHIDRLVRELCGFSLIEAPGGRVRVEDPADSPDLADALIASYVFDPAAIEPGIAVVADLPGL